MILLHSMYRIVPWKSFFIFFLLSLVVVSTVIRMNLYIFSKLFFYCFGLLSVKSLIICLAFSYAPLELVFNCAVQMTFTLGIVKSKFYKPYCSFLPFSLNYSVFKDGSFVTFLSMQWSKKQQR